MSEYTYKGYNRDLIVRARELRKNMTPQERRLWHCFLKSYPLKFYRQRAIDCFVVDFYCSKARLVIELDGSQHHTTQGAAHDSERTDFITRYGLRVLRFPNSEIDENFEEVCSIIDAEVRKTFNDS